MSESEASLQKKNLTRRLFFALVTPLLILLTISTVLGFALSRLTKDARFVDHSDDVLAKIAEVQGQVVDQETGLRGYLLTGNRIFLEPYDQARPLEALTELRSLVVDNPEQLARTDSIRSRYQLWHDGVQQVLSRNQIVDASSLPSMLSHKSHMDILRSEIRAMGAAEQTLRNQRKLASAAHVALTWVELVGLFVLAAGALGLLSMRQIRGVAATYGQLLLREQEARADVERESWLRAGKTRVAEKSQGELSVEVLGAQVLQTMAEYVQAEVGAFFTVSPAGWQRSAGFGLDARGEGAAFGLNEGQVGRAAAQRELVHLKQLPADYLAAPLMVRSGVGQHLPVEVVLLPAVSDKTVFAVVELGFLRPVPQRVLDLLRRISEPLAIAVRSAQTKERLRELLEESQRQTEELQTQQEELQVFNEELEEQTSALHKANARIAERQQELEQINTRLADRTLELQQAQRMITEKAAEAERASRYKSEFLANMSHELRTPLNSSLILAKLLADNKEGNLTAEQVRFAETIHAAGNDLLTLINDILDLSKIEAGKAEVHPSPVYVARMVQTLGTIFEPLARVRNLAFTITTDASVPQVIETDPKWLEQILRNLLSNAIKFTPRGQVAMHITGDSSHLKFVIRDSGIGIAKEQQELIFEAFHQADGASNRKYGGTGLGLSISRNLTNLLGGELTLQSELGTGTTFTLVLPRVLVVGRDAAAAGAEPPPKGGAVKAPPSSGPLLAAPRSEPAGTAAALFAATPPALAASADSPAGSAATPGLIDDRQQLDRRRRLALVIEDDVHFAEILRDMAHELGFQCLVAHSADAGLALAKQHAPSAIVLDMNLPGYHGLSVLDQLKHDPALRHIPVHVISVADYTQIALSMGAIGYVLKPAKREELERVFRMLEQRLTHRLRRLLLVEADAEQKKNLSQLLEGIEVELTTADTAAEALARLGAQQFDCMVMDLKLPDATGFELLEKMAANEQLGFPPVIVYAGRALSAEEEQKLSKFSSSIIVKGARSPERLLDEVTLFLHQVESALPPERQRMLLSARNREAMFEGRKILVVEDDIRSIFALSSLLEPRGATVVIARNGREALSVLASKPDISLVLMDIMMPEMDGLTAMREIRKNPRWTKLPIIALTAKAMADDQERCRQAGANDYITKPLNVEMLLSLLRVWMPKR